MKKNITFLLLFCVTYLSCKNGNSNKNEFLNDTVITIIFKERTFERDTLISKSGTKSMRLNDLSYSLEGDFREHQISKNNYKKSDTLKIYTNKDLILTHSYHYYYTSLYRFKPGDTVVFDYENDAPNCKIVNRKVSNEELNFFKDLNLKSTIIDDDMTFFFANNRFRTNKEKENVKKEQLSVLQLKVKKLDSLHNVKLFSDESYKMYRDGFDSEINSINNVNQNKLDKEIDLSLPYNRFTLINNINSIYKPILVKGSHNSHYDSKKQFDNVLQYKNIKNENKDFLLFYYFQDLTQDSSQDDIKKYFIKFSNSVTDKSLIQELSDKFLVDFSDIKNITKTVCLLNNKREKTNLDALKSNYKGKVLYIDFWASWCAPCRASMPSSLKLREKYKNKDVVFLYMSIDVDFDKWQDASNKEGLSLNSTNFLALNYPSAIFYKQLQLKSIPRYLIFDKKGNLVNTNAPGPDSDDIEKELNKYLAE